MAQTFVLGVDVGGTNTDAVIVSYPDRRIHASVKVPTTKDFTTGVLLAVQEIFSGHRPWNISSIMLGTTTFLNAALQCSPELAPVTVLRICGPTSKGYPVFIDFPAPLATALNGGCYYLRGGIEFDGKSIENIDENEVRAIADKIIAKYDSSKIPPSIVICGVFSSISHEQEDSVAAILEEQFKESHVTRYFITKSYEIAGTGLLEREGAAILNSSLQNLAVEIVKDLRSKLDQLGLSCDLFLTQNDGTLISCEQAMKFPIFTFNSGPTNSLRGAYQLAGIQNAIVVDIGGTSTDISVLQNGFPRPASAYVKVAGVRTNYRMPDTISVGLGGGSLVKFDKNDCTIGPASVGYKLVDEAQCFGGQVLVTTDIAVSLGYASVRGAQKSKVKATAEQCGIAQKRMVEMLSRLVDKMKTSKEDIPLILVGGGSILIPEDVKIPGISQVVKPQHFDVANAIGATIAQISAQATGVIDFSANGHEMTLDDLKKEAKNRILSRGAVPSSVELLIDTTHLSYMPGRSMQVTCTALGELDLARGTPCTVSSLKPVVASMDAEPFSEDVSLVGEQDELLFGELPTPNIVVNGGRKEWVVSEADIHCMAIGAGILGTGGGGSPYLGTLETLQQLRKGKSLRIIRHEDIPHHSYVLGVGYFGAPLIMIEKLGGALKHTIASRTLERYLTLDRPDEKLFAYAPVEIGGCNSLAPLFVGAERDIPVVDCDFMGRAFPQYPMVTPIIYGENPAPVVIRDEKDNELLITNVHNRDGPLTECFLRDSVVRMGCDGGVVGPVLTQDIISRLGIHNSYSHIWKLGRDILEARQNKVDPLTVITETQGGKRVFAGKIVEVIRATEGGYNYGSLQIDGFEDFANATFDIDFQNENLIAKVTKNGNTQIVATVPDLISLVDVDTYQPILTEDLRYGLRVSVLVLPAHPLLTTARGLEAVGPGAFGYTDVEYKSCGTYVNPFNVFEA